MQPWSFPLSQLTNQTRRTRPPSMLGSAISRLPICHGTAVPERRKLDSWLRCFRGRNDSDKVTG